MRLVDADELKSRLPEVISSHKTPSIPKGEIKHIISMFLIDNAPTIDAVPVVHGRWVEIQTEPERLCKCSECGYPGRSFWDKTKYCPSCGAKMDKEEPK